VVACECPEFTQPFASRKDLDLSQRRLVLDRRRSYKPVHDGVPVCSTRDLHASLLDVTAAHPGSPYAGWLGATTRTGSPRARRDSVFCWTRHRTSSRTWVPQLTT